MKVVIQCSATKDRSARSFSLNGRRVKFFAHPELLRQAVPEMLFRPDDMIPSTSTTWRDHLLAYNNRRDNPDSLLRAADLYSPEIYRSLIRHVGEENLFILSAGWGLIRADFLVPDYDITFSSQADSWKRRNKRDVFHDFAQMTQAELSVSEPIYFFGGKDYLPLYYKLTRALAARMVIYFASGHIPREHAFVYKRYHTGGTNWHYRCARDFIAGTIDK